MSDWSEEKGWAIVRSEGQIIGWTFDYRKWETIRNICIRWDDAASDERGKLGVDTAGEDGKTGK